MPPADVRVTGLSKAFGATLAVRDVSFELAPGQLLALLGPSGCGKTTTLRAIAGLVRPDAGSVFIQGQDVTHTPVHRRGVGMLFQNYALFPHMTAAENVAFGLDMRGVDRAEKRRLVDDALRLVQLVGFEDRMPQQLSGGQQQRVALARALVVKPLVLLLDEPFGALDRRLRESMQIEMRALQERIGVTTILVTHDQEEALTLANLIAVMRDGDIEQIGSPGEIYRRPVTRFVADFIGSSNFFEGRIVAVVGGQAQIESNSGVRLLAAAPHTAISVGDRVTVALRPEHVRLNAAVAAGINSTEASLERIVYRGLNTHYHLRLADGAPLIAIQQGVDGSSPIEMAADRPIRIAWDSASAHIVRDT
jgi:putative spermidine/putrescine transport system ATP-binding protein